MRNAVAKVSKPDQDECEVNDWKIFDLGDDVELGGPAVAEAIRRAEAFRPGGPKRYPAAVKCVVDDLAHLTSTCAFRPNITEGSDTPTHRTDLRRVRRRGDVIGRLPGEATCVSLVWTVPDRASRGWRGLTMPPTALRLLQDLRRQLLHPRVHHDNVTGDTIPAAA